MCGRFSLFESIDSLQTAFNFEYQGELEPRYNIAPGSNILAVIADDGRRQGIQMRWGFIPSWADDEKIGYRMINARAETAAEKPSFRNAFRKRRCLILADGFYEWKKEGKEKRPYRFELIDNKPFAFAGLWENWEKGGKRINSCTILTTGPNELTKTVHDRMPVILPAENHDLWLDASVETPEDLQKLMIPYKAEEMKKHEISSAINSAKNEGKELIRPINSL